MELSFSEIVVLSAAAGPAISKRELAHRAVKLHASKRYTNTVALADIKGLVDSKYLVKHRYEDLLELTKDGWRELQAARYTLQGVEKAIDNAFYYGKI